MAAHYVIPTISPGEETGSYIGPFGVGELRRSFNGVTWTSGDTYYQATDTTDVLAANVTPGGNNTTIRSMGTGAKPIILSNGGAGVQYGMYFSAGSNTVVRDLSFQMINRAAGYAGVRIGGTTNFQLLNCNISGYDINVPVQASAAGTIIEDCDLSESGDDGLTISTSTGGRIARNRIRAVSRRVTTGDCIQFLDAVAWGAWVVEHNELILDAGTKQCVMIGVPSSSSEAAPLVRWNTCRSTVGGIHARHAANVYGNYVELGAAADFALQANPGNDNQAIGMTANIVRCLGGATGIDGGATALRVRSEVSASVVHNTSFDHNLAVGRVYRGFAADSTIDGGTVRLRNNGFENSVGDPALAVRWDAGATATLVERNSQVYGFTSDFFALTATNPVLASALLVDPSHPWLGLSPDSPCWNAGVLTSAGADYFGKEWRELNIGPFQQYATRAQIERIATERASIERSAASRRAYGA